FDRDGYLSITGRKKNLILRQSGEKVSVEALEAKLAALSSVERAVVIGGGSLPWLVAIASGGPACDAAGEAQARLEVAAAIAAHNNASKPSEKIDRTIVTKVPFTSENGLLTRNLKLDRNAIQRYFESELTAANAAASKERTA